MPIFVHIFIFVYQFGNEDDDFTVEVIKFWSICVLNF